MSSQILIESMERLLDLHQQLQVTANKKTEILQKNDIQLLGNILRTEQKLVADIQVANNKRERAVQLLTGNNDTTMTKLLEMVDNDDRDKLVNLQENLKKTIDQLQQANDLNHQLLQYSLQFVNLNLDLLAPEPELPNYAKTQKEAAQPEAGRSIFDSKA